VLTAGIAHMKILQLSTNVLLLYFKATWLLSLDEVLFRIR